MLSHAFHVFWIFCLFCMPDVGARRKPKTPKAPPPLPPQTKTITITRKVPPVFVPTQRNLGNRPTSLVSIAFSVLSTSTESAVGTTSLASPTKSSPVTAAEVLMASNTRLASVSASLAISEVISSVITTSSNSSSSPPTSIATPPNTNIIFSPSSRVAVVSSSSSILISESSKSPTPILISSLISSSISSSLSSTTISSSISSSLPTSTISSSISASLSSSLSSFFDQFGSTITATATVTITQAVSITVSPSPTSSSSLQQSTCAAVQEIVPLARVPAIAEQIENLSNVIGRLNAILGRLIGDDSTTTATPRASSSTSTTEPSTSEPVNSVKPTLGHHHRSGHHFTGNDGTATSSSSGSFSSSSSSSSTPTGQGSTSTQRSFSFTVLAAVTSTATAAAATAPVPIPVPTSLAQLPKEAKVIDNVDFQQKIPEFNGPNKSWSHFSLSELVADDGTLTFEKAAGGMAVLNTNPFKKYVGPHQFPELDNIKFEAYSDTPVELPANKTTCFEWLAQAEIFGAENSPYPANYTQGTTDLRLAAASFSLFDPESDHSFQFLLTNDRVYAIYERLSIQRGGPLGNYASYTFAQPVAVRNITSWHALKIAMEAATRQISWHIEGQEVFRVTKVGGHILGIFPIINMGGYEVDHYPTKIHYGFGAQTLLNAYKPNNHVTPPPPCYHKIVRDALVNNASPDSKVVQIDPVKTTKIKPASFFDPNGTDPKLRVWGQGAISRVKQIRVYII